MPGTVPGESGHSGACSCTQVHGATVWTVGCFLATCRESSLVGLVATAPWYQILWPDAAALHMLHLCFD